MLLNLRPDLRTSLMNMSLVLRLPREMHLYGSSSNVPRLQIVFGNATNPSRFLLTFFKVHTIPCACHAKGHLNVQKCPYSTRQFFALLTSKFASRHNGVQFFNVSTSNSAPRIVCFAHFDFEICFPPQRQFFISHLARWLRTRHFSEPTFRPSGATNHWRNTVFRDFPTFSRTWIFFLLTLSLL